MITVKWTILMNSARTRCGQTSVQGQKAKYSLRAHIVRFAPVSGLKSAIAGGPFRATIGLARKLFNHLVGAHEQRRRHRKASTFAVFRLIARVSFVG